MEQNEVSLIALSSPSAYTGVNSAEQLVAYAARVSNPANQNNTETAGKLVRYLIKENHWSPL
jgi:thymidylate synthase (FAD)